MNYEAKDLFDVSSFRPAAGPFSVKGVKIVRWGWRPHTLFVTLVDTKRCNSTNVSIKALRLIVEVMTINPGHKGEHHETELWCATIIPGDRMTRYDGHQDDVVRPEDIFRPNYYPRPEEGWMKTTLDNRHDRWTGEWTWTSIKEEATVAQS